MQDDAILAHNPKPSSLDGTQIDQQRLARRKQLPLHSLDPNRLRVAEFGVFGEFRRDTTIERFQAFLRLAVAAGPLLGLIGTVIGMINTFQSITETGSSDPKLMATGIGQAMIATVLGLGIAIPLLFVNAGLATMSLGIVQVLDEQSNGLLAEHIERKNSMQGRGVSHA